ncbi:HD domain-containing phosphohydrolase [uncultured Gilvimarinus sp.]|uniref:HD domain-containing phosphohydrolase n=1 Tax=uncultured Gilvimarinus sp. TaxID=1689143 RepID=UPI0030D80DE7
MQSKKSSHFTLSIRVIVLALVALAVLLTAACAISLQYYFSRQMAIEHGVERYQKAAVSAGGFIEAIERRAEQVSSLLTRYPSLLKVDSPSEVAKVRNLFAEVLGNNELFYSIYLGFPNGDFFEVVNLDTDASLRSAVKATKDDRWLVNRVRESAQGRIREFYYFDKDFNLRAERQEPSRYDVRQRRWFNESTSVEVLKSEPYVFQYIQAPGQTYSVRFPDSDVVLGIDITLQSFSQYLRDQNLGDNAELFVYDDSGEVLGSNLLSGNSSSNANTAPISLSKRDRAYLDSLGPIRVSNELDWAPIDFSEAGRPKGYSIDLLRLLAQKLQLNLQFINGYRWQELVEKFSAGELDVLQPLFSSSANRRLGLFSDALAELPYAVVSKSGSAPITNVMDLKSLKVAAPSGWTITHFLRQSIGVKNIVEVEDTQEALLAVQSGRADATIDYDAVLRHTAGKLFLNSLQFGPQLTDQRLPQTLYLAVHPSQERLLGLINLALMSVTDDEWLQLENKWLGSDANPDSDLARVPYPFLLGVGQEVRLKEKMIKRKVHGVDHFVLITPIGSGAGKQSYFAAVIPVKEVLASTLNRVRTAIWITALCLLLLLPFVWLLARPIVRPILALAEKSNLVKERRFDHVIYTRSRVTELNELAISMTNMADSICAHEEIQRTLMDSFIQLIAEAIDEKSPYTGGHCARVPELGLMLADAAHASSAPAFADFQFKNKEQWREFKIAAWLHDCGKITVPEYVVDKSVKLETIYNRIHEVRTRFEVLLRDAEIDYWQARAQGLYSEVELQAQRDGRVAQLHEDFAFVAKANIGGEFMDQDDIDRLTQIGAQTWQRHFDRNLGISAAEQARVERLPQELPATEKLLDDRPEHIVLRTRSVDYEPYLEIDMEVPEYLYNRGELYNLSIARGTLTREERFKINEHMISTIRMLDRLPFPPELARVPRYASTHHEAVNGTGYPRKLKGDQLSVPEKVLVVADIFEALTAADRPYKEAKSIAAAIDIMAGMVDRGHIDGAVFELFLTSGVYLKYAREYLSPVQIVDVNIQQYIGDR